MCLKMNTKTYYYMCAASFFGYEILQDGAPTPLKLVICWDGNIMLQMFLLAVFLYFLYFGYKHSLQLEIKCYFSAFIYKSVLKGYFPWVLYKGKINAIIVHLHNNIVYKFKKIIGYGIKQHKSPL